MVDDTDTMQISGDSGDDTGGGGDGGSFDPSFATDSLVGGLGDAASSLWHAAGHVAHGVYDYAATVGRTFAATGDAFIDDRAGVLHQEDLREKAKADAEDEFHQAGQDLLGN
jgi:hypothetical protein